MFTVEFKPNVIVNGKVEVHDILLTFKNNSSKIVWDAEEFSFMCRDNMICLDGDNGPENGSFIEMKDGVVFIWTFADFGDMKTTISVENFEETLKSFKHCYNQIKEHIDNLV